MKKKSFPICIIIFFCLFIISSLSKIGALSFEEYISLYSEMSNKNDEENKETNRIILRSNELISSDLSISEIHGYEDLHVFQFDNEKDTRIEFERLSQIKKVKSIYIDSYVENQLFVNGEFSKYYAFGADKMEFAKFSNALLQNSRYDASKDVIVAVLDTGVDVNHEWLKNRIVMPSNPLTDFANVRDSNGHGTHVSGIIADLTLPNVKILPIKALNNGNGTGTLTRLINSIEYVVDLKKNHNMNIVAINMSLGNFDTYRSSQSEYDRAITKAYEAGIFTICSAGNNGSSRIQDYYPASAENAIAVGSVDVLEDGTYVRSSFSNYGSTLDFVAFGNNIESARNGGGTIVYRGTSMSAPYVSSVISMLCSADFDNEYCVSSTNNVKMNNLQNIMKANAIQINDKIGEKDLQTGYGLVRLSTDTMLDTSPLSQVKVRSNFVEGFNKDAGYVSLYSEDEDVVIYYTLDGKEPTLKSGIKYDGNPILVDRTLVLKAISYRIYGKLVVGESEIIVKNFIVDGVDFIDNYDIEDGVLVHYFGTLADLRIPSRIGDKTIHTIGSGLCTSIIKNGKENSNNFKNVRNLIIDDGISLISSEAFKGCNNLISVDAKKVKEIGDKAFDGLYNLSSIDLSSVEILGNYVFNFVNGVNEINLPNIKTFRSHVFDFMSNLKILKLGKNLTKIEDNTLYKTYDQDSLSPLKLVIYVYNYDDSSILETIRNSGFKYVVIDENDKPTGMDDIKFNTNLESSYIYTAQLKLSICVNDCESIKDYGGGIEPQKLKYTWYKGNEVIKEETIVYDSLDKNKPAILESKYIDAGFTYFVKVTNMESGNELYSKKAYIVPTNMRVDLTRDQDVILPYDYDTHYSSPENGKYAYIVENDSDLTIMFDLWNGYIIDFLEDNDGNIYNRESEKIIINDNFIVIKNITSNMQFTIYVKKVSNTLTVVYCYDKMEGCIGSNDNTEIANIKKGNQLVRIEAKSGYEINEVLYFEESGDIDSIDEEISNKKYVGMKSYVFEVYVDENDIVFKVLFKKSQVVVDFALVGEGNINLPVHNVIDSNESLSQLEISPASNHFIKSITVNGLEIKKEKLLPFLENIKESMNIEIVFEEHKEIVIDRNGRISVKGDSEIIDNNTSVDIEEINISSLDAYKDTHNVKSYKIKIENGVDEVDDISSLTFAIKLGEKEKLYTYKNGNLQLVDYIAEEGKVYFNTSIKELVVMSEKEIENPGESNPGESNPGESNPGESNPEESNPGESNPGESNPGESNPEENNPGENNPEESNPEENIQEERNHGKETTSKNKIYLAVTAAATTFIASVIIIIIRKKKISNS